MAITKTFRGRWIVISRKAIAKGWEARSARRSCPLAIGFMQSGLFECVIVDVDNVLVTHNNDDIEFALAGQAKKFYHGKVLGLAEPPEFNFGILLGDIPKPQPFAFYIPKRGTTIRRVRLEKQ